MIGVASVADVRNPRPDSWVSDQAHVLAGDAHGKLDALAAALNHERGVELAIVTVDDTPGVPKAFATEQRRRRFRRRQLERRRRRLGL